jgi:hypothetical protein
MTYALPAFWLSAARWQQGGNASARTAARQRKHTQSRLRRTSGLEDTLDGFAETVSTTHLAYAAALPGQAWTSKRECCLRHSRAHRDGHRRRSTADPLCAPRSAKCTCPAPGDELTTSHLGIWLRACRRACAVLAAQTASVLEFKMPFTLLGRATQCLPAQARLNKRQPVRGHVRCQAEAIDPTTGQAYEQPEIYAPVPTCVSPARRSCSPVFSTRRRLPVDMHLWAIAGGSMCLAGDAARHIGLVNRVWLARSGRRVGSQPAGESEFTMRLQQHMLGI